MMKFSTTSTLLSLLPFLAHINAAPLRQVRAAGDDIQKSQTLDPSVLASGFLNNGQSVTEAGQVASLVSGNNFINFCAITLPATPITDGKQISSGSCNPAPMGSIPSISNMPSAKFVSPLNFATVKANTAFTVTLAIQGMETGNFVNAQQNYFAAPQQLNAQGQIIGHSHIVIEALTSLTQTTPNDPSKFAFFKGLNAAVSGGQLTADVAAGLPAGVYKVSTINTAANHQPVLVPIAQHGSLDDVIYFTVTADGKADGSAAGGAADATGAAGAADASATATDAAGAAATGTDAAGAAGAATGTDAAGAAATGTDAAGAAGAAATAAPGAAGKGKGGKGKGKGGKGKGNKRDGFKRSSEDSNVFQGKRDVSDNGNSLGDGKRYVRMVKARRALA